MPAFFASSLLALSLTGCFLVEPSAAPSTAAAKPAATRPVVTAETRLVIFPYGHYSGRSDRGTATLDLQEDQHFTLSWQVTVPAKQGQWSGEFEWLKNASGFESLAFFGVREAVDGQLTGSDSDRWQVVSQMDQQEHRFAISVPDLGTVLFAPR